MNCKTLLALCLTTTSLSFGQSQMPKWSDLKKAAKAAATGTPAATATPAATSVATPTVTAKTQESAFTPLAAGPMKGAIPGHSIELTLCEKGAREGQWDVACTKAARTFQYKGSVTNVFGTFRFSPPLTNEATRMKVVVYKGGVMDEYREITFNTGGKTALVGFTKGPGAYDVKVVDQYDNDKVYLVDKFVVAPDTVGDRATDNVKSGSGKLMICSEIDDNWKCVNESTTWSATKPFNMYVRLPEAVAGLVAGWAVFKQNADGSDGTMEFDIPQGTKGRAKYWATTNGNYLKPGVYTVYSIAWPNRSSSGNFKEYFAKTTLTIK